MIRYCASAIRSSTKNIANEAFSIKLFSQRAKKAPSPHQAQSATGKLVGHSMRCARVALFSRNDLPESRAASFDRCRHARGRMNGRGAREGLQMISGVQAGLRVPGLSFAPAAPLMPAS
jgi:hypothetical protein